MTKIIAFQGVPGAYSQQACRQYFGNDVATLPCQSFNDMFMALHYGKVTHIMLPVENSVAGTVSTAYDTLSNHDFRVQGEEIVRVRHCLVAPEGVKLQDVKKAKSHWQALAQCQATLYRMGIQPVNHLDTAGAAQEVAQLNETDTAAISSELAAQLYGLTILARDLQDSLNNYTRFFVIGREDAPRGERNKTSIIFVTRNDNKPGALNRVLSELDNNGISMTKLESRPRQNVAWHYRFFVDFEGHEDDENVRSALAGILRHTSSLKILGSYPAKALNGG